MLIPLLLVLGLLIVALGARLLTIRQRRVELARRLALKWIADRPNRPVPPTVRPPYDDVDWRPLALVLSVALGAVGAEARTWQ